MKRTIIHKLSAWTLVLAMILTSVSLPQNTKQAQAAAGLPGARSCTDSDGNVFLGGNYIEVGISKHGSFGTSKLPEDSVNNSSHTDKAFHPHDAYHGLGLQADQDGWNVGNSPIMGDFFLPGSPEERWTFAYKIDGQTYTYAVSDRTSAITVSDWKTEPQAANISSGDMLQAQVQGETKENIQITIVYTFDVDDLEYKTDVSIKNLGEKAIEDARFVRSFDPDQDQQLNGTYDTYNKVVCNPVLTKSAGADNYAMVVSRGPVTLGGFFFLAVDNRAKASIMTSLAPGSAYDSYLWDSAPVTDKNYAEDSDISMTTSETNGYVKKDTGIALTFNLETIKAGRNDSLTYYSSLNPDVKASLDKLKKSLCFSISYKEESISGFDGAGTYDITQNTSDKTWKLVINDDMTYQLFDENGTLVDSGKYDEEKKLGVKFQDEWYGSILTIQKRATEDTNYDPASVFIPRRLDSPENPQAPNVDNSAPDEIKNSDVITTTDSIVINGASGQEYSIDDGKTWKTPGEDNKVSFTELESGKTYVIKTRYAATDTSFSSEISEGLTVKTMQMFQDVVETSYEGEYDEKSHAIKAETSVEGATVSYSTSLDGEYRSEPYSFSDARTDKTIYYKVEKTGYYTLYGKLTARILPKEVKVIIQNAKKKYGEKDPKFSYKLTISGKTSDAKIDGISFEREPGEEIGNYEIRGYYTPTESDVYNVQFENAVLTIDKADQEAPQITAVDETIEKKADGQIKGLTTTMEYRKKGEETFEDVTDPDMLLAEGTYEVREAEKKNYNASDVTEVTVGKGRKLDIIIPEKQTGYTLTSDVSQTVWNGNATLTLDVADGYSKQESFAVKASDKDGSNSRVISEESDGMYKISGITTDTRITVEGIADVTEPTGQIDVAANKWTSFLNTITFGKFFNESKDVTITAEDAGSKVKSISYYVSDKALTQEEVGTLKTEAWKTYEGVFSITPDRKAVIYAKLEDNAGNVRYISTDGMVLDAVKPVITGVKDGEELYIGHTYTVHITEENLDSVYVTDGTDDYVKENAVAVENGTFTLTCDSEKVQKIIAVDKAGNQSSIQVNFVPFEKYKSAIKADIEKKMNNGIAAVDKLKNLSDAQKEEAKENIRKQAEEAKKNVDKSSDVTAVTETQEKAENVLIETVDQAKVADYNKSKDNGAAGKVDLVIAGDPDDKNKSYQVGLKVGNTEVEKAQNVKGGENASFDKIPDGVYNLVVSDGEHHSTTMVIVKEGTSTTLGNTAVSAKNTTVETQLNAPDVAAGGLDKIYNTDVFTENKKAVEAVQSGKGNVDIKLLVDNKNEDADIVNQIPQEKTCDEFIDFKVLMTVMNADGTSEDFDIKDTKDLVLLAKPLSDEEKNRTGYMLYRKHSDGVTEQVEKLPELAEAERTNTSHEGFYIEGDYLYVWAQKFSVYALAYDKETKPVPSVSESPVSSATPSASATPSVTPQQPSEEPTVTEPAVSSVSAKHLRKNSLIMNAKLKVSQKGNKIRVSWGKLKEASGYDVYVQYCGKKFTAKSLNSVNNGNKGKIKIRKVNGKKLKLKKNYKIYVQAYKMNGDRKVVLGKTITAHIVGRKNTKSTNVKAIKLAKKTFKLKVGKRAKIKGKTILVDKNKKPLSNAHAKELRFASNNRKIVAVSKNGRIKAKRKGKCIVYVYARNGYAKKVRVKVK